ncbi:ubiquitin protein ligase, putative [Entamoeba dispar SAW760]|uniref:HECT-type E3 ubiquitin transferase n=1 Tax=Entamoeba dispar (strain ATCC PRA-260 / SAW760) TaxID=370354 RepID=B0EH68_ENTDS|nr:ubiquitin protein ligase, putative [Entamoeba dispar SAW760]EDR26120.1 ubiquitin protein ligase, putative [Entamoeba dispar SAW760]|eukprot:EDR26120.1 ubiquitin protein ligase, putative [Entamoeba dispar SAW760]
MRPTWRVNKKINLSGTSSKSKSSREILLQIQIQKQEREANNQRENAAILIQSVIRRYQVKKTIPSLFVENFKLFKELKGNKEYSSCITAATLVPCVENNTSALILLNYQRNHPLIGKLAWNLLISEIQLNPRAMLMLVNTFINKPTVPKAYPNKKILPILPFQLRQQLITTLCLYPNQGLLDYFTIEGESIIPLSKQSLDYLFTVDLTNYQSLIIYLLQSPELPPIYEVKFISELSTIETVNTRVLKLLHNKKVPVPTKTTFFIHLNLYKLLKQSQTLLHLFLQNFPFPFLDLMQPFIETDAPYHNDAVNLYISLCHDVLSTRLYINLYEDMLPSLKYLLPLLKVNENQQVMQDLHLLIRHSPFPPSLLPFTKSVNPTLFSPLPQKLIGIFSKLNNDITFKSTIKIRRDYLIEDSLAQINHCDINAIQIKFVDQFGIEENGVDGGGLLRDYLISTLNSCVEVLHLFERNSDGLLTFGQIQKNLVEASEDELYQMAGRLIGKCLNEKVSIDLVFSDDILIGLTNPEDDSININTLASIDYVFAKNLNELSDMSEEELKSLELTFTYDNVSLITGGDKIFVNKNNVNYYISCVIFYITHIRNSKRIRSLRNGLLSVIKEEDIRLLFPDELQHWISGKSSVIDVNDWQQNTVYHNIKPDDQLIQWFWSIVESFSEEEKSLLLQFSTSLIKPPFFGFGSLEPKFAIYFTNQSSEHLPTSSTCAYMLRIPNYNSKEEMKQQLIKAITSKSGFAFS